jgi:hypothetical protein
MPRQLKSPIELASDIGSKAMDLLSHGDVTTEEAFRFLMKVNPEIFQWLQARLAAAEKER